MRFFWENYFRNVETGGGAAPEAATAPAAPEAAPAGGGLIDAAKAAKGADPAKPAAEGADPAKPAAAADDWFPKGLDAKLKGKDANETLTNLAKHLGEQPKAPEKADAYTFKPGEKTQGRIDPATDKVLPLFRDVAHQHGLTQGQFEGVIEGFYSKLIDSGMMKAPVDVGKEIAKLGGPGDPQQQMDKGHARIAALEVEIDGLATRKMLPAETAAILKKEFATSADGVIAFEALLALIPKRGDGAAPVNGGRGGGQAETGQDNERSQRRMYPTMYAG